MDVAARARWRALALRRCHHRGPEQPACRIGVWTGAPTYAAGRFGQALNTNATRYVTVPHDAAITRSNDFTVDAWSNTTTIANTPFPVIVLKSDNEQIP